MIQIWPRIETKEIKVRRKEESATNRGWVSRQKLNLPSSPWVAIVYTAYLRGRRVDKVENNRPSYERFKIYYFSVQKLIKTWGNLNCRTVTAWKHFVTVMLFKIYCFKIFTTTRKSDHDLMNSLKKAFCEERGIKSTWKDAWAATTCCRLCFPSHHCPHSH